MNNILGRQPTGHGLPAWLAADPMWRGYGVEPKTNPCDCGVAVLELAWPFTAATDAMRQDDPRAPLPRTRRRRRCGRLGKGQPPALSPTDMSPTQTARTSCSRRKNQPSTNTSSANPASQEHDKRGAETMNRPETLTTIVRGGKVPAHGCRLIHHRRNVFRQVPAAPADEKQRSLFLDDRLGNVATAYSPQAMLHPRTFARNLTCFRARGKRMTRIGVIVTTRHLADHAAQFGRRGSRRSAASTMTIQIGKF